MRRESKVSRESLKSRQSHVSPGLPALATCLQFASASAFASAFPPHLVVVIVVVVLVDVVSSYLVSSCLVFALSRPQISATGNRLGGGRRSLANEPRAPSACIRVIRVAFNLLAPAHLNTATAATTTLATQPPVPPASQPASRALHCALCMRTHAHAQQSRVVCVPWAHSIATPARQLWRPSRPLSQLLLSRLTTTSSLWPPMATSQPPGRPPRILISSPWACLSLVCAPRSLPCVWVRGCVCLSLSRSLSRSLYRSALVAHIPPVFRVSA